jgi:hypothetical protein
MPGFDVRLTFCDALKSAFTPAIFAMARPLPPGTNRALSAGLKKRQTRNPEGKTREEPIII